MKLPNAKLALVEPQKIKGYLLNREHPDNGGKADFFIELGFSAEAWETLAEALRRLAIISARQEVYCRWRNRNSGRQSTHGANNLDRR